MLSASATEYQQRIVANIVTSSDGYLTNRGSHVRIGDVEKSLRNLFCGKGVSACM